MNKHSNHPIQGESGSATSRCLSGQSEVSQGEGIIGFRGWQIQGEVQACLGGGGLVGLQELKKAHPWGWGDWLGFPNPRAVL